jgi:lipopolysaccharide transport system permease protein
MFMVWALTFFTAPLNAIAADVGLTLRYLLTIAMIVSPVFYPITRLPEASRAYMWYNPLACMLELYRWGMFHQHEPSWWHIWFAWGAILAVFVMGWWFFSRREQKALEEV